MEKIFPSPAWIYKRDGRLVPFEADKISQSIFAASESLNRPDAFTARELTDGVLHFLTMELGDATPSTTQVAELVVKVVRELGQSAIAQAYADFMRNRHIASQADLQKQTGPGEKITDSTHQKPTGWPLLPSPEVLARHDGRRLMRMAGGIRLQEYSLREIFTRDIAAAHEEGLITLCGLEAPFEIQGAVLAPGDVDRLVEALEECRNNVGQFIAVDSPEFTHPAGSATWAAKWCRDFFIGLRATGLDAVINLNCANPPSWAQSLAKGPLFGESSVAAAEDKEDQPADILLDQILSRKDPAARIHWHLSERDFIPKNEKRLRNLVRLLLVDVPITVAFDRPGWPISCGEGLDRHRSSLLIAVGLHLPHLLEQPGVQSAPDAFLRKLRSLTRLPLTAAVQKRRFLTRYPRHQPAFLVDRARLSVIPIGLESVTRHYTTQAIVPGSPGADFASRIVRSLHDVLQQEGPMNNLDVNLDSGPTSEPMLIGSFNVLSAEAVSQAQLPSLDRIAGLTTWDDALSLSEQVMAAASLQASIRAGTAWLLSSKGSSEEELMRLLRFAWKESTVARIRFMMNRPPEP
jgi:hypothetical protein